MSFCILTLNISLFLSAKGMKVAEINRQVCEVYRENIMSDGIVRRWVRAFKDDHNNVHDEERTGSPSISTDDLMREVDKTMKETRRFTISSLSQ